MAPTKQWDVFIAHASEDKERVAAPLADELRRIGLKVWYDEFVLSIGDSLVEKIDEGLASATRGVVILSPAFFRKDWTRREYQGLVAREMDGNASVIPVWHGLTYEDVLAKSPPLAQILAANTDVYSIPAIAFQVANVVQPDLIAQLEQSGEIFIKGATEQRSPYDFNPGPIRHPELPLRLRNRIAVITGVFQSVFPNTTEEVIERFRRDSHPEKEVEQWEAMAAVFLSFDPESLVPRQRKALFDALLAASGADQARVSKFLRAFSGSKAKKIRKAIDAAIVGRPITVGSVGIREVN